MKPRDLLLSFFPDSVYRAGLANLLPPLDEKLYVMSHTGSRSGQAFWWGNRMLYEAIRMYVCTYVLPHLDQRHLPKPANLIRGSHLQAALVCTLVAICQLGGTSYNPSHRIWPQCGIPTHALPEEGFKVGITRG